MFNKPTSAELIKRLKDQGLFDLPSDDGDPADHVKAILHGMRKQTPQQVLDGLVAEIAAGMVPTMAHSLPELGRSGAVRVHQVIDWRINAMVSDAPPYEALVSTNLVKFLASMISALNSGIGIQLVDDQGNHDGAAMAPRPDREVARDIKRLLDGFIAEQQVLALDFGDDASRTMVQFRLFHCALSWVLGHELGHIVVSESRRLQQPAPFEPLVRDQLDGHFQLLLGDKRFRAELSGLDAWQQQAAHEAWLTELNADVIGASLACGYQKDHGPSRTAPGIVGVTKYAIHLGLIAHYMLDRYQGLFDPAHPQATPSHPPIDFRMFCVLQWMYKEQLQVATAAPTAYAQQVFTEVLRQAGFDLY